MDYCAVTTQIAKYPAESIKNWGIETVRDFLGYQEHVHGCTDCQILMDAVIEEGKDKPQRPDPTSLN